MPIVILSSIAVFIFLISMMSRLIKAVEHIAETTGKTAQMLERMVDKLESTPGNLPPAE
jgi:hypothetical protein